MILMYKFQMTLQSWAVLNKDKRKKEDFVVFHDLPTAFENISRDSNHDNISNINKTAEFAKIFPPALSNEEMSSDKTVIDVSQ